MYHSKPGRVRRPGLNMSRTHRAPGTIFERLAKRWVPAVDGSCEVFLCIFAPGDNPCVLLSIHWYPLSVCVCVSICSVFSLHYLPASTRLEDHQRWCGGDYLGESVPMGRWKRSTVSRWMCIYRGGPPNQGVDRVDWSSSFFQGVELGGLPILIHTHIYRCFPRRSRLPLPT